MIAHANSEPHEFSDPPRDRTGLIGVLVVDDDLLVRTTLSALIRHEPGFSVVGVASDPSEAVDLAMRTHPEVAVVDVKMPRGGGVRATRDIARVSPGTRVMALSAAEDRGSVLEMLAAGAVGYSVKSEEPQQILEAIKQAAEGKGSISAEVAKPVIDELADRLRAEATTEDTRATTKSEIQEILRDGGPRIVYQPIVDVTTGVPVGVESLARFDGRQPYRSPDLWLADAATVGMRIRLEMAAATNALAAAVVLPEEWFVSINLSPETILDADVASLIGLTQRTIVVEITEHSAIEDYAEIELALHDFRTAGGKLAVDDAGAGFATFRHILRLSPELIKVDISLVRNVHLDARKRALAAAFVSYGMETGAQVIAEGVEWEEELATLRSVGLRFGQGYLWSHPVNPSELGSVGVWG